MMNPDAFEAIMKIATFGLALICAALSVRIIWKVYETIVGG
jgi:hypothetical protein